MKRICKILWVLYFCGIALFLVLVYAMHQGWVGYMPQMSELQNPIDKYASQMISADGKVLGTFSRGANRIFIDYDSIAPVVFRALIDTEDERFEEHSGIDVRAVGRAVVKRGLMRQKSAGGGSTITQQLAKQLYSANAESTMERLMQKPQEWVIAVELERYYTKEEIMTLYLNYFDFLHNAVGIRTAARVYFDKHPSELTTNEAATLIGMCKNPAYYNPVRFPERTLERRNVVLSQMVKAGDLLPEEYATLSREPLMLRYYSVSRKQAGAPYVHAYLRRIMMAKEPDPADYPHSWQRQQYYQDSLAWETDPLYGWCNKNRKRDGSHYNLFSDGLKVYTTIDSRMQRYAEEALKEQVARKLQPLFNQQKATSAVFPYCANVSQATAQSRLRKAMKQTDRWRGAMAAGLSEEEAEKQFYEAVPMAIYTPDGDKEVTMTPMDSIKYYKSLLRGSIASIEPETGYVRAAAGGIDFQYFQYDMAIEGRRQVGSTMKPIVYAMAIQGGDTPETTILNAPGNYGGWTPRNGSSACAGQMVTLKWGLTTSNNWVTARLMSQVDPTGLGLVEYLKELGVANHDMQPSMALCLGTCDITALEMASAYTAFVQKGIRRAPIFVTRIEDAQGNVVAEFAPRTKEVFSEETAFGLIDMMRSVIDHGTGRRLRYAYNMTGPIAGKTGTTNGNSDGWFVGCVPQLVTACWVGGDERDIHFNSTALGQGSASALPIWALYMKKVYADKTLGISPNAQFADFEDYLGRYRRDDDEEATSEAADEYTETEIVESV